MGRSKRHIFRGFGIRSRAFSFLPNRLRAGISKQRAVAHLRNIACFWREDNANTRLGLRTEADRPVVITGSKPMPETTQQYGRLAGKVESSLIAAILETSFS